MFQFLASIAAVVISSPKAKQALRSLAVKGTVAALEVKDQIGNTIRSLKDDSEVAGANLHNISHNGNTLTTYDSSNYLYDHIHLQDEQPKAETLPDLKHTFAVLDDKTIEKYLPKP